MITWLPSTPVGQRHQSQPALAYAKVVLWHQWSSVGPSPILCVRVAQDLCHGRPWSVVGYSRRRAYSRGRHPGIRCTPTGGARHVVGIQPTDMKCHRVGHQVGAVRLRPSDRETPQPATSRGGTDAGENRAVWLGRLQRLGQPCTDRTAQVHGIIGHQAKFYVNACGMLVDMVCTG